MIKALYERQKEGSEPGNRNDRKKVAIAIEGGGMRGCVAAGTNQFIIIITAIVTRITSLITPYHCCGNAHYYFIRDG